MWYSNKVVAREEWAGLARFISKPGLNFWKIKEVTLRFPMQRWKVTGRLDLLQIAWSRGFWLQPLSLKWIRNQFLLCLSYCILDTHSWQYLTWTGTKTTFLNVGNMLIPSRKNSQLKIMTECTEKYIPSAVTYYQCLEHRKLRKWGHQHTYSPGTPEHLSVIKIDNYYSQLPS